LRTYMDEGRRGQCGHLTAWRTIWSLHALKLSLPSLFPPQFAIPRLLGFDEFFNASPEIRHSDGGSAGEEQDASLPF
jgi:hypothetical protein